MFLADLMLASPLLLRPYKHCLVKCSKWSSTIRDKKHVPRDKPRALPLDSVNSKGKFPSQVK